ncbi:type III effector [Pseudomonas sp. S75]|uniref:type III effector n=1 Tax=unclassified Pseudomonas TaxID=196821 RepID=UPI001908150A|nr:MULTISPECIES: type III effector [unclassified Pseudomonas]MBJ9977926.1 type III effector [Pseudomonas sp. S30]MBK0155868.1 type III effector [Pseudomonas sp. S75]
MADLSVSQGQSLAALRQQSDDAITPVTAHLSGQVRPSTTPLVPYHFTGAPSQTHQQALASKHERLQGLISGLSKQDREANPIGFAREQMKLEGEALASAPGMGFKDMHQQLAGLGGTPHAMLSGREETQAFIADFDSYLGKSAETRQQDGGFGALWDAHCERVGDTLGAYHSLCQEVIEKSQSHEDLPHLHRSHEAFRGYAKGVVKTMTEDMPARLNTFLQSRIDHAQAAAGNTQLSVTEQQQAHTELTQLQAVRTELRAFIEKDQEQPATSTPLDQATKANKPLDNALKNVAREDHIAELKTHSGFVTGLAVFADAGIPQGVASAGHFGASTSAIDEQMAGAPFAQHLAATSTVLGASHKVISDGIRPFVQAAVDKTIGRGLAKVDPMSVYPQPLKDITKDGLRVANPNFDALKTSQKDKRDDFKRLQNANNFGTMSGDFAGYLAFGTAHAVRELLNQFASVNASGIGARSLASAAGGMFMAGGQAVAKYSQTHGEERIPTYRVTQENRDWGEVMPSTLRDAVGKLNPANMTNLSDLLGRITGASPGVAMRMGAGDAAAVGENAADKEKMEQVITTFFSSGLTLLPFFANAVAAPLENKALHGKDELAKRPGVAMQNVLHPDRETLPHTQPVGVRRNLENIYHVTRGLTQVVPQTTVGVVNMASDAISSGVRNLRRPAADDSVELAERGKSTPQSKPTGEGPSSSKPA